MSHERKQPTKEELRELLDACSEVFQRARRPGKRTAWNERVLALREAFELKRTWTVHEDQLKLEITEYLHAAGAYDAA